MKEVSLEARNGEAETLTICTATEKLKHKNADRMDVPIFLHRKALSNLRVIERRRCCGVRQQDSLTFQYGMLLIIDKFSKSVSVETKYIPFRSCR